MELPAEPDIKEIVSFKTTEELIARFFVTPAERVSDLEFVICISCVCPVLKGHEQKHRASVHGFRI